MSTPTQITLAAINMDADDPAGLAQFWAAATGGTIEASQRDFATISGAMPMMFLRRSDPRPDRQGQHLDLTAPWGAREDEVARLISLGASHRWDVLDEVPGVRWSTLSDPEGNLFCIAEHTPAN